MLAFYEQSAHVSKQDKESCKTDITLRSLYNKMKSSKLTDIDLSNYKESKQKLYKVEQSRNSSGKLSGYVHIDIDPKDKSEQVNAKALLHDIVRLFEIDNQHSSISLAFVSPSQKGVKLWIAVDNLTVDNYSTCFYAFKHFIDNSFITSQYNIQIDSSGHIVNGTGLCYVYNTDLVWLNKDSLSLDDKFCAVDAEDVIHYATTNDLVNTSDKKKIEAAGSYKSSFMLTNQYNVLDTKSKILQKIGFSWTDSNRNDYIFRIASFANSHGIDSDTFFVWAEDRLQLSSYKEHYNRCVDLYKFDVSKFGTKRWRGVIYDDMNVDIKSSTLHELNIKKHVTEVYDDIISFSDDCAVIVEAPTGSGKTYAMSQTTEHEVLLFLAPTTNLVKEFAESYDMIPLEAGSLWHQKIDKLEKGVAYVMTYDQSQHIVNNEKFHKNEIRLVIDEAHELVCSLSYRAKALGFVDRLMDIANRVILLTATPQPIMTLGYTHIRVKKSVPRRDVMTYATHSNPVAYVASYIKHKTDMTFAVLCSRKQEITELKEMLDKYNIDSVCVSSSNNKSQNTYEDFSVDHHFNNTNIRVLIGTIKISQGMSITKKCDALLTINVTNPVHLKQFIARPRNNRGRILALYNEKRNLGHAVPSDLTLKYLHSKQLIVDNAEFLDKDAFTAITQIDDSYFKLKQSINHTTGEIHPGLLPVVDGTVNERALARIAFTKQAEECNMFLKVCFETLNKYYDFEVKECNISKLGVEIDKKIKEEEITASVIANTIDDILANRLTKCDLPDRSLASLKIIVKSLGANILSIESLKRNLIDIVFENGNVWNKKANAYLNKVKKSLRGKTIVNYIEHNPESDLSIVIKTGYDNRALPTEEFIDLLKSKLGDKLISASHGEKRQLEYDNINSIVISERKVNDVLSSVYNTKTVRERKNGKKLKKKIVQSIKTQKDLASEVNLDLVEEQLEEDAIKNLEFLAKVGLM